MQSHKYYAVVIYFVKKKELFSLKSKTNFVLDLFVLYCKIEVHYMSIFFDQLFVFLINVMNV